MTQLQKRILVTGGTGMIGAYILRELKKQGYTHITATYHRSPDRIPSDLQQGIHWRLMHLPDVEDAFDSVADQDWVIHTAGMISYTTIDREKLLDINRTGTTHLVNAALAHGVKHFIYLSSVSTLGKERNHVTLDENSPWLQNQFSTMYGLSKYLGELEVWRGAAEGLPVSVIVPSVVLGTGDWNSSSLKMIRQIDKGPSYCPTGATGFVDVRDMAHFIHLLLIRENQGERWLLNGINLSYPEVFEKVSAVLQQNRKFKPAPRWAAGLVLTFQNLFSGRTLGHEVLRHVYGQFSYDGSKASSIPGFQYRNFNRTLEEVIRCYREGGTLVV